MLCEGYMSEGEVEKEEWDMWRIARVCTELQLYCAASVPQRENTGV